MTLLGAGDGDAGDYGDILVELEARSGERLAADRRELYARAALNVAVHNTDDHLRNHGLLAGRGGWRLSPVFDVNPDPELGDVRQTSIAGAVAAGDERDGLVALADDVGLHPTEAEDILERVVVAVSGWEGAAERAGVSDAERRRFAPMFEDRIAALASGRRSARVGSGKPRSAEGRFVSRREVE